jgi:hypothetical protein
MQIEPNDPTLSDASKMLADMEAAEDAADQGKAPETTTGKDSALEADRAGQGSPEQVHSTNLPDPKGGTPADKEPQKPQDQKPAEKPADKPADPKASKFAENQQRLMGGWKTLNAEKETLKQERETFQRERDSLVAERKQLEDERQKVNQPKYKPEDYENYAREATQKAMAWNEQAQKLEGEGKFDEADKAAAQSKLLRQQALQAKERADHLRANPPKPSPTAEQAAKDFEVKRKEWYGKALTHYPAFKDKTSEPFKRLTAVLTKGAEGYDPIIEEVVNRSPEGMYYAARLVQAETLAASVAQKDKEIVELRAKVKELDEKAAIPADAVAQRQAGKKSDEEMSDEELEADLKRQAEAASRF